MTIKLGSGSFIYEAAPDWAKLPDGWTFHEVVDVAVDSETLFRAKTEIHYQKVDDRHCCNDW